MITNTRVYIQERVGSVREKGRTLFGRISSNILENDVGVCRNIAKM